MVWMPSTVWFEQNVEPTAAPPPAPQTPKLSFKPRKRYSDLLYVSSLSKMRRKQSRKLMIHHMDFLVRYGHVILVVLYA